MKRERWIVIPNWDGDENHEGFQHYRDRQPKWIKNYRTLLSKPEYNRLTFPQRGLLHGLWLMYAESNRSVPVDTLYIGRALSGRVTMASLQSLRKAGFIRFSASKPLARRLQAASPEVEVEKEVQKELPRAVSANGGAQPSDTNINRLIDVSLKEGAA